MKEDVEEYPAKLGYSMPPEWSHQEAVWLSWPVEDSRHWGGAKHKLIEERFSSIVSIASRFQTVRVNVNPGTLSHVEKLCLAAGADPSNLELYEHPHNDVWCRDHGPIFVRKSTDGKIAMTDWRFNAWGGKFPPWDADNSIPRQISEALEIPRFTSQMVLEGGAIEVNGSGQLLTTEAVLLNPNRNPEMTRSMIEEELRKMLGINEVLWLKSGIEGDDTDGHIDDLTRFVDDSTIVTSIGSSPYSKDTLTLEENFERLQNFKTTSGRPFDFAEIPLPETCEVPGWRLPILPASYVNFLIVNRGVLVPTFRQPTNDDWALGTLKELFPDREVVGIDCLDLVEEGGTLHCLTQQQPA